MKLEIWHNILWSRYKAATYSALYDLVRDTDVELQVFQIAETERDRVGLSGVDLSVHQYPMVNLFKGSYADIALPALLKALGTRAATTTADVTILSGYERPEFWLQAAILRIRGRKFAVFCDSTLYDKPQTALKTMVKRAFFGICENAFCYGKRSTDYLTHLGVEPDHIFIRRQAAAPPQGYDPAEIMARRLQLAATPQAPVFLFVGRLSEEKRVPTLIRAFKQLLSKWPAARLQIVGDGPMRQALTDLVKELDVVDAVDIAGSKSGKALYDCYLSATCFVLPSWSEPWGLVVNEALTHCCPVIVSNRCGCVPELVENSDCGMVFACDDVADLADKLTASVEAFSDTAKIAQSCLDKIAPFNSRASAQAILDGAREILRRDGKDAA